MKERYFELEERINNFQKNKKKGIEILLLIDNFCPILFNNTEKIEAQELNVSLDEKTIEKLIEGFFKELNLLDEYLNNSQLKDANRFIGLDMLKIGVEERKKELQNLLTKGLIDKTFYDKDIERENEILEQHENYVSHDGQVIVTITTNNILNIWNIVHENIHKIYHQTFEGDDGFVEEYFWSSSFNKRFLQEVPSITAELLLNNYLENNIKYEFNSILIERFNSTRECMAQFHFEMILIKIYNQYHQITDEIIDEELQKEEEPLKLELIKQKQKFIEYFGNSIVILPYVFGTIVACTLKEKVEENPEVLNQVGKFIYDNNLIEDLQYLGIDFTDSYETVEKYLFRVYKKTNYKLNEKKMFFLIENYLKEYNKIITPIKTL